ncbi:hypothetical protein KFL_003120180 [Klebsormidium nitens]|uniref:Chitin-binding type-2 domain-containing protein n=1 Tax=Klebsormidium nitens TaxID=105231 RepID=A0A1Y1IA28_KLENI|nr:hypothetical protein KFL_003120180 [Klebsormidium nitens]|eukprot:GAQ86812.1 hypothetical protein KFL_003120180 [Klebsormidium nitens]
MGIYPDLSDPTCRKFYRCQPIGPFGKSIKIDMVCPPGTVFHPVMYCVPPKLLPPGARCSLKLDAQM